MERGREKQLGCIRTLPSKYNQISLSFSCFVRPTFANRATDMSRRTHRPSTASHQIHATSRRIRSTAVLGIRCAFLLDDFTFWLVFDMFCLQVTHGPHARRPGQRGESGVGARCPSACNGMAQGRLVGAWALLCGIPSEYFFLCVRLCSAVLDLGTRISSLHLSS